MIRNEKGKKLFRLEMGIKPISNQTNRTRTHILGRTEPKWNWTASNRRRTRTEPNWSM